MNGAPVECHIDTRAEVTVISRKLYSELDQPPLQRSGMVGINRTGNNLTVMGSRESASIAEEWKGLKGPGNTTLQSWDQGKLTKINSEVDCE